MFRWSFWRKSTILTWSKRRKGTNNFSIFKFRWTPPDLTSPASLQDLLDRTFWPINKNKDFSNNITLSLCNKSVQRINDIITDHLPGNGIYCYSIDSAKTENFADPIWTDDYLYNVTITEMQLHKWNSSWILQGYLRKLSWMSQLKFRIPSPCKWVMLWPARLEKTPILLQYIYRPLEK